MLIFRFVQMIFAAASMQLNALAVVFIQMVPAVIFPIIPSTFRTASIHDLAAT